jgi:CRISPR-associated endonuclease Csn1
MRKLLGLLDGESFNLENGDRKKLDGNKTDHKLSKKEYFGKRWLDMPEDLKNEIVRCLADPRIDADSVRDKALREWNCTAELAEALTRVLLPDGFASLSVKAIEKLLPFLERGLALMANDETDSALHAAGYLRRDQIVADPRSTLPEVPDDITNPLVRQALREVRNLVHAVLREYGRPAAIHLELAREVQGGALQRAKTIKTMRENEARRDAAATEIKRLGYKPTREAIIRYRLWQDQKEHCLYSGRHISPVQLLAEGGEIEIDHILPRFRSLDDSQANKVVCFRDQNQAKGDRTPYEWLARTDPDRYEAILQRAKALPMHARHAKLERMTRKEIVLDEFIARQLTDTAYITRKVHEFLQQIGVRVVCVKGRHTAELRNLWSLNSVLREDGLNLKNREDHRHHAVDALVIAMTNHRTLQSLAWYWKMRGEFARDNLKRTTLKPPCDAFRELAQALVDKIVVSHKARRKVAGALHEETVYGPTDKPENGAPGPRGHAREWTEEKGTYVLRKPLTSLTCAEVLKIRDPQVQALVIARLAEHGIDPEQKGKKIPGDVWAVPLRMVGKRGAEKSPDAPVIKTVRILKKDETIRPIRGGRAWVKPGNTHHICLFEIPGANGKKNTRDMVSVPMIDAIRRAKQGLPIISRVHPTRPDARFLFSLSQGEMVRGTFGNVEGIFVYKTSAATSKQMWFVHHLDAQKAAKQKTYSAMPNSLNVEKILVDRLGRIRDARD